MIKVSFSSLVKVEPKKSVIFAPASKATNLPAAKSYSSIPSLIMASILPLAKEQ